MSNTDLTSIKQELREYRELKNFWGDWRHGEGVGELAFETCRFGEQSRTFQTLEELAKALISESE